MHASHGELLIGGMTLRDLTCELGTEEPEEESHQWRLAGHLHVPPREANLLELRRQYLLRLSDGREGLVELTRMTESESELLADFAPRRAARPR